MFKTIGILTLLLLISLLVTEFSQAQEEPKVQPEIADPDAAPTAQRNPFVPQLPIELLEETVTPEEIIDSPDDFETGEIVDTETSFPTLPVIEKEKPILGTPTLVVSGILWNSNKPQAIVNGNIVGIGDKMFSVQTDQGEIIEQIEFVEISKDGVSVAFKNRTVTVNSGLEPPKGASR